MPKTFKINEIFSSLQGEGRNTGVPAVFVRFSGCNLKCPFCDTDHHDAREMTLEQIAEQINRFPEPNWVILTGGEPLMQADDAFIRGLKYLTHKDIAIETNGTFPIPDSVDWATVSPKDAPLRAQRADEIKVVDLGQDLEQYFDLPCRSADTCMYLQPCHTADPQQCQFNLQRTIARVMSDPRWTLSLQTHRLINIR